MQIQDLMNKQSCHHYQPHLLYINPELTAISAPISYLNWDRCCHSSLVLRFIEEQLSLPVCAAGEITSSKVSERVFKRILSPPLLQRMLETRSDQS